MKKLEGERKILVNGFWRSGTSFLYLQLAKNFDNSLYEPLNPSLGNFIKSSIKGHDIIRVHPYFSNNARRNLFYRYYKYFEDNIFDIIKKGHPNTDGIYHVVYNFDKLQRYLSHFKDFNIKEVSLHLYLKELSEYWDVYHIIRHPVDTFISIINNFYSNKFVTLKLTKLHWILRQLVNKLGGNPLYYTAKELMLVYGPADLANFGSISAEEAFVISWTISNYIAVRSITKENLIIYEDLNSYKKLPFEIHDQIKPEIFPRARERYNEDFSKLAERYNLSGEYDYLLRFFD